MSDTHCKVVACRFPNSHTTSGHKCGHCGLYGHGVVECGNYDKINSLRIFLGDPLPLHIQCQIVGCTYKWSHTTRAHHCSKCGRNHHSRDCIISYASEHDTYRNVGADLIAYDNIYICHGVGMGCRNYIRKKGGVIEKLFMHSDCWGQYGPETDDTPIYEKFIQNMVELNSSVLTSLNIPDPITGDLPISSTTDKIKCPLCRTENDRNSIKNIKGLSDKCSICLEKPVEVYFPTCEHACVCNECFSQL